MVKKSFMFGFGVGIIVICVLFYILSGLLKPPAPAAAAQMSDQQIEDRAATLGMVFIKDAGAAPPPAVSSDVTASPEAPAAVSAEPSASEQPTEPPAASPEPSPADTATPSELPDTVRVYVAPGSTSQRISALLHEAGVVDDADKFNRYIGSQGKATKLMAGWFEIPKDADYQTVLGIITKISRR